MSKQDRVAGMARATFALSNDLTAFADLSLSKTKTVQDGAKRTFTTALASTATAGSIVTWPTLSGKFLSQGAIILPVGHPDNPTNGTAQSQAIQLIPRFEDLNSADINELKTLRFVAGVEGIVGGWDVNSAVMYSRIESTRTQQDRLRSSLLTSAVKNATYHFGKWNDAAARATIASDAINNGDSKIMSVDVNASRELFDMAGGKAAVALGGEVRREELEAIPDANYLAGDYIGLVANGTKGKRDSYAAYTELRLPVLKSLEVQAALRGEHYSDFGNSTTGKLGFKYSAIPQKLAFRGTAATGFRAPGLAQIGDSYVSSFHSFSTYVVPDSLRCAGCVSKANPSNNRDCNVLGFSGVTPNPGNIPTVIAANPNLKAETSKSFTFGVLVQPADYLDLALDFWYFQRNNEIRAQRGVDIMEAYNANPADPLASSQIIRDPNTATWLPGIANSGPIIALTRKYGNYNWTKTSGVDYDVNLRLPNSEFGKFTFSLSGSWTPRFDQLVLTGGTIDRYAGTSSSDIPKTKAKLTMNWKKGDWTAFTRLNHQDGVLTTTTASCLTSTSAANVLLQQNGWCKVNPENTVDIGGSYRGFKNLTIAASVLNVQNAYDRSTGVPNAFNYWDPGANPQFGRRYSLTATYTYN
jgi:iron complex outermembrane receptor protein